MIDFEVAELTPDERDLRDEVRAFLDERLPRGSYRPDLGISKTKDPAFSRELSERGWVGMALPKRYGGQERSAVERFVVSTELLRRRAPIGHHWVADRQIGPMILKFGTEAQRQRFLPPICRGEMSFSIGMSEPDSGSDLASVQTTATRIDGGWLINGRKIWSTQAHLHDWSIILCRSTPIEESGSKWAGLSRMLVGLHDPGVAVRTIPYIDGTAEFCEVVLDDVFVPDDLVLGEVGAGWTQVGAELAFERSGPERWISTYLVVEEFVRTLEHGPVPAHVLDVVGASVAQYWVLYALSLSVARMIDAGNIPGAEASMIKEMGTRFEQDVVTAILDVVDVEPSDLSEDLFGQLLFATIPNLPALTVRGGTNEVLRGVVAKGLWPKGGTR